jgi:hypothetical protein
MTEFENVGTFASTLGNMEIRFHLLMNLYKSPQSNPLTHLTTQARTFSWLSLGFPLAFPFFSQPYFCNVYQAIMAKLELHNGYPLWHYVPSLPAAIAFVVIFSLVTLGHSIRMFRHRVWFGIPMVVGGVCKSVTRSSGELRKSNWSLGSRDRGIRRKSNGP